MTKTMLRGAAALLVLTALAGCDKSAPDQPAASENGAVPETNVTEPANAAAPAVTAHSVTTNATEAVAREAPLPPDEQTQDDADATGMTARVRRDEAASNETVQ
jgi:hypothetical protein